jgi:hypothetical protein
VEPSGSKPPTETRREDRDRIRQHLQVVARSFAAGDFTLPMQVHAQTPPGAKTMKKMRKAIAYAYSPTDKGGEVRISTSDPAALSAIHAFLRFQIEDHGTGRSDRVGSPDARRPPGGLSARRNWHGPPT